MKGFFCPACHARISLDALVQDQAGRKLMALLAGLNSQTGAALIAYLNLFRSPARELSNGRALRLANEALAMSADAAHLTRAMCDTVEAIRRKGQFQPLRSHGYLRRVLASGPVSVVAPAAVSPAPVAQTKQGQAVVRLQNFKRRK